jgi:hypothetical protein
MVEWIDYPVGVDDEDGMLTIAWRDEATDLVPANALQ